MFLIQIRDKSFIDAEKIECVYVDGDDRLCIVMSGMNSDDAYICQANYESSVLNHIQAINKGCSDVECLIMEK